MLYRGAVAARPREDYEARLRAVATTYLYTRRDPGRRLMELMSAIKGAGQSAALRGRPGPEARRRDVALGIRNI